MLPRQEGHEPRLCQRWWYHRWCMRAPCMDCTAHSVMHMHVRPSHVSVWAPRPLWSIRPPARPTGATRTYSKGRLCASEVHVVELHGRNAHCGKIARNVLPGDDTCDFQHECRQITGRMACSTLLPLCAGTKPRARPCAAFMMILTVVRHVHDGAHRDHGRQQPVPEAPAYGDRRTAHLCMARCPAKCWPVKWGECPNTC